MRWIKLFDKTLSWGWFTDVPTAHLWVYILLRTNYKDDIWLGEEVKRGSFITSINKLSVETGLSPKQVRLALSKLEKTGEITVRRTNKYTVISVEKWETYQTSYDEEGTHMDTPECVQKDQTKEREGTRQRATVIEVKNNRRVENDNKKRFVKPTLDEVREYCTSRNNGIDPETFIDFYESKNWMVGKTKMADWRACVRTWERSRHTSVVTKPADSIPTYDSSKNRNLSLEDEEELLRMLKGDSK